MGYVRLRIGKRKLNVVKINEAAMVLGVSIIKDTYIHVCINYIYWYFAPLKKH